MIYECGDITVLHELDLITHTAKDKRLSTAIGTFLADKKKRLVVLVVMTYLQVDAFTFALYFENRSCM